MSSMYDDNNNAGKCIDGITDGSNMCLTVNDMAPWLALDFGEGVRVSVEKVVLHNMNGDDNMAARTRNVEIKISDELPPTAESMFTGGDLLGTFAGPGTPGQQIEITSGPGWHTKLGRYIVVQMNNGDDPLNLIEVTASVIHPAIKGQGTEADWDFCSIGTPCSFKQGDCDSDDECVKGHLCGENNCRDFRSEAAATSDCCVPGKSWRQNCCCNIVWKEHCKFCPVSLLTVMS